ncbi:CDGSH iron-sulfur domain-containing protein [Opitutia bacterium ISCC 51]|nr:CDGSH iron-sulfur domain-containing protein [Opitutae bacterium ISCC 51]QXD29184.1 CDGSH iron-sulfur domain-containing protein [Opitutae bacterium ISCC 52]
MSKPIIAANTPTPVELEAGKSYAFCTCGHSDNQPFCDGKHAGSGMAPKIFKADKDGKAWLCQCKATQNAPFCDGSHKPFGDDQVGKEVS